MNYKTYFFCSEINFKLENAFELLAASKEMPRDVHLGTDVYWKRFDLVKKVGDFTGEFWGMIFKMFGILNGFFFVLLVLKFY